MNQQRIHEQYMMRCLDLAQMAKGNTAPNPMVGSVIVHNGLIIGEGFHQKKGEPHAEVNAIVNVQDKSLLPASTMYVSLEPCSHHGKTPPCTDTIIRHQIPRVVIGVKDPNPLVNGKGIKILEKNGINVISGIKENQCKKLNKRFFTYNLFSRPYIILKWAQTKDGFIDYNRPAYTPKEPTWITNEIDRALVHKWRSEEASILAGTNTADKDNPKLNTRDWAGNDPLRMVIDRQLRLPGHLSIFDQTIPTIIFNNKKEEKKANQEYVKLNFNENIPSQISTFLYNRKIQSMIVEGGQQLINSFIHQGLWDEARVFTGNVFFHEGIKAPRIHGEIVTRDILHDSELNIFKNNNHII